MLETLEPIAPDAIIGIMALFRQDPNPRKVDLSVGVYQDESGATPVLNAVRKSEQQLIAEQSTKTYVAIAGNAAFNKAMEGLVFGAGHPVLEAGRAATVQSPGGSGGLSVAAHLLQRAKAGARVWVSDPSWPNHMPLLRTSGLTIEQYPYYDRATHAVDFTAMTGCLERADRGDVVLLHACCHNPCGADLSREQWQSVADLFARRGLVPLLDSAYQGLSAGLDEDAYGVRLLARLLPELVVVSSCSKNFGLYRERVGAVSVVAADARQAQVALSNLSNVARSIYSMPPDHGAAIVARVLENSDLRKEWEAELASMRARINGLRRLLVEKLRARGVARDFSFVAQERGMFSFLGLSREQVLRLREEFHVYMVETSRVNVAGINQRNVDYVVDAIASVL